MNSFSFTIPQNIKVGAGSLSLLPDLAKELDKSKAYIISGPHLNKIGMVAKCQEALMAAGMDSDAVRRHIVGGANRTLISVKMPA